MQRLDRSFARFARDPRRLTWAGAAMLAMSLAYNVVAINLAIVHGVPVPPPFGWMEYEPWRRSVDSFGIWFWIVWVYLAVYIAAFAVLYPAAVRAVHGLAGARAWITAIAGVALYQGFILIFIR